MQLHKPQISWTDKEITHCSIQSLTLSSSTSAHVGIHHSGKSQEQKTWENPFQVTRPSWSAMEEYIQEALQQGYIHLSMSPASVGFFFMEKKGGGLRPCINCWRLIQITIKYHYPLSLVPAALEQLCSAQVFTKQYLCSAFNMVCLWEISTTSGHPEYCVLPYGLSGFQCIINDVLRHAHKICHSLRQWHLDLNWEQRAAGSETGTAEMASHIHSPSLRTIKTLNTSKQPKVSILAKPTEICSLPDLISPSYRLGSKNTKADSLS